MAENSKLPSPVTVMIMVIRGEHNVHSVMITLNTVHITGQIKSV